MSHLLAVICNPHHSPQTSTTTHLSLCICWFWMFCLNGIIQCMASYVWILSCSIVYQGSFFHAIACIRTSLPFMAKEFSIVWIYHILFTHSSVDGHLDWFCFLAFINTTTMSIMYKTTNFLKWSHHFITLSTMYEGSNFPLSLLLSVFF